MCAGKGQHSCIRSVSQLMPRQPHNSGIEQKEQKRIPLFVNPTDYTLESISMTEEWQFKEELLRGLPSLPIKTNPLEGRLH